LSLKIVADENVDFRIVKRLKKQGFCIISILERFKGITDEEVLKIAISESAMLLTEDKDFGEWVFSHGKRIGVILLRYKSEEVYEIMDSLIEVVKKYGEELKNKFTVITSKKIRIRTM